MSISSVATQDAPNLEGGTPQISSVPSLTASSGLPMFTPPQTPGYSATPVSSSSNMPTSAPSLGSKREGDAGEGASKEKRRRIAPTPVDETEQRGATSKK